MYSSRLRTVFNKPWLLDYNLNKEAGKKNHLSPNFNPSYKSIFIKALALKRGEKKPKTKQNVLLILHK